MISVDDGDSAEPLMLDELAPPTWCSIPSCSIRESVSYLFENGQSPTQHILIDYRSVNLFCLTRSEITGHEIIPGICHSRICLKASRQPETISALGKQGSSLCSPEIANLEFTCAQTLVYLEDTTGSTYSQR